MNYNVIFEKPHDLISEYTNIYLRCNIFDLFTICSYKPLCDINASKSLNMHRLLGRIHSEQLIISHMWRAFHSPWDEDAPGRRAIIP